MLKELSIKNALGDKAFQKKIWSIALPIALQNLVISSINMADVFMVGKLGISEIASLGIANQISFLLILYLFGVNSGTGIFTAQFYGKNDFKNIHKVLGISLVMSILGALLFLAASFFMPEQLIRIFSKDKDVIHFGANYLKIIGLSFPVTAISFVYAIQLRNIGKSRIPLLASFFCLFLNIGMNYLLIFGKFGFPKLGIEGAAIGTLISRFLECVVLLMMSRKTELSCRPMEMLVSDTIFLKKIVGTAMPVIFNEMLWSLGITAHSVVYARLGTEEIASVNIGMSIDRIAFVAFIGLASASGVMIGHKLGEEDEEAAYDYSIKLSIVTVACASVVGAMLIVFSTPILSMYSINNTVFRFSKNIILVMAIVLPFRSFNATNIVGILRSGGDTRYCLLLEVLCLWLIGVPCSIIGGLYLKLPVYFVFLLAASEELLKFFIGGKRMFSKKWIKTLVNY